MNTKKSQFNRNLFIFFVILFVFTIAAVIYFIRSEEQENMEGWMLLLNIPFLSIPLGLLYGSIYVLAIGWRERSTLEHVSPRTAKIIRWAPRIAAILIIIFVSLFSLDVFEMEAPPLELLGGFLMHNLPSIGMLVLLVFAWKRPVVGFVAFLVAAAIFAILFVRSIYALPNLLLFVLPILLIAALFYADWQWLKPQPPEQGNSDVVIL